MCIAVSPLLDIFLSSKFSALSRLSMEFRGMSNATTAASGGDSKAPEVTVVTEVPPSLHRALLLMVKNFFSKVSIVPFHYKKDYFFVALHTGEAKLYMLS